MQNEQLLNIAQQFGTPLYVYNAKKIEEQYLKLSTAFNNSNTRFFYACKALTNINILKYINKLGCGIDCSSINEVKLALHIGVAPSKILYTSNGIAFDEIKEAVILGVHINIDSLSNLEKFGKEYGNTYKVGLRLKPNILAGGNLKISTGHEKSKFGIPLEQIEDINELVVKYDIIVNKLHIHTGSDIKDADIFLQGLEVLAKIVDLFPNVEILDLGGGFKVPYQPNHDETNINLIAEKLLDALKSNYILAKRNLQLWFEPGKYLVSECGFLITQVNVIKQSNHTSFVGINSGLNHLIRPMFYDAYHHINNISNPEGEEKIYTVTGNICETDTFAVDRRLPETSEGDFLVFHNAGAYGFEMASNYNSRFKPAEVIFLNDKTQLIRKADSFDDLLQNQIDISF